MYASSQAGLLKDRLRRLRTDELVVIEGANVIDGTGDALKRDVTIVIQGGLIERIVPARNPPDLPTEPAPTRLGAAGSYVLPGLIDCHAHINGEVSRDRAQGALERYPEINLIRAAQQAARVLAAGFTTVRHLGHGIPAQTQSLKQALAGGVVNGPRMLTAGWAISQTGGHGNITSWPYHLVEELRPRSAFCDGPDACRKFVRQQIAEGADCIKIYTSEGVIWSRRMDLPNFTLEEIAAMTDEAHRLGARVAAHATGLAGSRNAVLGEVDTLEHGPHAPDDELIKLMAKQGTVFDPTLRVFEWAASADATRELPAWAVERAAGWLPGRRDIVRAALEAGVTVSAGSDSGVGGQAEILALERAGLTALQALSAATRGGAIALGIDSWVGTIEVGKRADLLILSADPSQRAAVVWEPSVLQLIVQAGGSASFA